jgi:hypothetical protein
MIRTRFPNRHNVLSLRIERRRRRLWQRKAERDQAKAMVEAFDNHGYFVGLLIPRNAPYLTKADRDFLDRLYAMEPGKDGSTFADKKRLHRLISRLMPVPDAVITYSVDPDEVNDGGTGVAHAYTKRQRKAA